MNPNVKYITEIPSLTFFQLITSYGFIVLSLCILIPFVIGVYLITRFMIIGNKEYIEKKKYRKEQRLIKKEIGEIRKLEKKERDNQ